MLAPDVISGAEVSTVRMLVPPASSTINAKEEECVMSPLPPETWNSSLGLAVPIPTFPLPCCKTNCEPPMVKPWPLAIEVVPVVPVIARKPVVVAPPKIVRPVACVPPPIVEEPVRSAFVPKRLVAVSAVVEAYWNCDVEEAKRPVRNQLGVVVALVLVPKVERSE